MTVNRNKKLDIKLTDEHIFNKENIVREDKSWLDHTHGSAELDYDLLKGATVEDMIRSSGRGEGSILGHIRHLDVEHGLVVSEKDGFYKLEPSRLKGTMNKKNEGLFKEVQLEHVLKAVQEFNTKGAPKGLGSSKFYDVRINDVLFPPKPIMAYANFHASGRPPGNYFSGGVNTRCFKAFEKLGIEIVEKTKPGFNEELVKEHFEDYIDYCKRSQWLTYREAYKFRFGKWLSEHIDFDSMNDQEVLNACVESQNQEFDFGEKGINFIKSSNRYHDDFITLNDISVLRKLSKGGDLENNDLKDSPLSFPKLSCWAGSLIPERYKIYANEDLLASLAFLYGMFKHPKAGLKAFKWANESLLDVERFIKDRYLLEMKSLLVTVFPNEKEFSNSEDSWLIQDFLLYLHRRVIKKVTDYYWVNQGSNYKIELEHNCIAATTGNLHHHKRLKSMMEGDVIINYANSAIKATSVVTKEWRESPRPYDLEGKIDLVVEVEYSELEEPISIETIQSAFKNHPNILPKTHSPFNRKMGINQAYCLSFNEASYNLIFGNGNSRKTTNVQYWLYSPGENAEKWEEFYSANIMAIGWDELGDLKSYATKEHIVEELQSIYETTSSKKNDATANYEFKNELKKGDVVIAKKGKHDYIGYGIVSGDYYFDSVQDSYKSRRRIDWIKKGQWRVPDDSIVTKTLTNITRYHEYVNRIKALLEIEGANQEEIMNTPLNQILYGPPGTGKTYHTLVKAAEIVSGYEINDYNEAKMIFNDHLGDQIEFITFHQNYSYEDFIQGLRPDIENNSSLTFDRRDGIFLEISKRALENLELSEMETEALNRDSRFNEALTRFIEFIEESDEDFEIPDSVAKISEVTDKAFRYQGPNWAGHGSLMKFGDLREFYRSDVQTRQDIKHLSNISGLANWHASYFLRVYNEILKFVPENNNIAERVEKKNYVIIIDEINRANISRVFGELITLIEPDKRSHGEIPLKCTLPSGEDFMVPSNLYIIGTMNTADKSIALLDIALRRRFVFEAMYPQYDIINQEIYDVDVLQKINKKIIDLKGHDFQIGHAYFMGDNDDLVKRMNQKVIPLLLEYFMNDEKEVKSILTNAELEIEENSWPLKISGKRD